MLYRIKFEKTGLSKYISHLDLNRLFMRAINRAGVKISYSEGFNPHQKLTFASTLSLGVDSFCEFADIKTQEGGTEESAESAESILERLSSAMPNSINIKEVYSPETPLKDIAFTQYNIYVSTNATVEKLQEMFSQDISVEKKSKTKTEQVVINNYIKAIDFDEAKDKENAGYIKIDSTVKTGNDMYLNPEYIIKAIKERFTVDDYFVIKLGMFNKDGTKFR